MHHVVAQIFRGVVNDGSRGTFGEGASAKPESVESHDLELAFQEFFSVFNGENPVVKRCPENVFLCIRKRFFLLPLSHECCGEQAFPRLNTVKL